MGLPGEEMCERGGCASNRTLIPTDRVTTSRRPLTSKPVFPPTPLRESP